MIGQDIGCEWGDADGDQFFSKRVLSPLASGMQRLFFEKPVTSLIIFVCWYSLIEVPLEFGMRNDDAMLPAAVVARLIVIVEGLGRCHGCLLCTDNLRRPTWYECVSHRAGVAIRFRDPALVVLISSVAYAVSHAGMG
ncbi:hypothetical protein B0G80_7155 [Paraburkholderia sp. BL6669N2]|uniref:hypothetical protein n=1 Tax=Paraburkholderia sp. BL6669N2 TaxID=1938807 RepID=UPI000E39F4AD|nr:hypothetical protein [Paraburkholderia sp. BL6669N2]REG50704.1 hypothetical protein B0G80_7155 [Paraburkholderia sp. BL6669N2]